MALVSSSGKQKMKLAFISRVGTLGPDKIHVLIPKENHEVAKKMLRKE
jgi:hypothetical protein